jgi:glyoxylase-like metal-dependent hydrolase (beta-lactamase superfamily II)
MVTSEKLGDGLFRLTTGPGSYDSLIVEFRDHVMMLEAGQSEARALAYIAETKKLIPNKPIRYLVNTHHHFDHLGGIRTFVAEGATIVTHARNRDFYERVVFSPAPRTLQPDRLSLTPRAPVFETVNERYALSDGTRVMEMYAVPGLPHNQNMLIAYLPKEKIVVQGDLFGPPAPGAPAPAVNASNRTFRDTVQRLKLDIAQIASIHGRVATWDEFAKLFGPQTN